MTSAPVLRYPLPDRDFILDCDSSDKCIGAELSKIQENKECPISYGSLILTPAQRKYCTTRKELLAVVHFTREYRHYLLGRKFYVRIDHISLAWLMRFKRIEGQLAGLIEELSQFDMQILHHPGRLHINADCLSRILDTLDECNCYNAGADLENLPCVCGRGCHYCTRAQQQ